MIVPIYEAPFYTSSINYGSTASDIDQPTLMSAMNLTNDELCKQLKFNLTEVQQAQIDWVAYGCVQLQHAPGLTDKVIVKVIVLSLMGIISLIGNIATIWNIQKNRATRRALRHSCSAIYALILHLSVADILVTFFCIIGEALWSYTVQWIAGEIICKLVKIFQMFALYLSTNVLVLIGIDRWVAVKYPMKSKFLNTSRFLVSVAVADDICVKLISISLCYFQVFVYVISLVLSLPQVSVGTWDNLGLLRCLRKTFPRIGCFGLFTALRSSFTALFIKPQISHGENHMRVNFNPSTNTRKLYISFCLRKYRQMKLHRKLLIINKIC